jgi:hypothetical protein
MAGEVLLEAKRQLARERGVGADQQDLCNPIVVFYLWLNQGIGLDSLSNPVTGLLFVATAQGRRAKAILQPSSIRC